MQNSLGINSISLRQPRLMAGQAVDATYLAESFAVALRSQVTEVVYVDGGTPGNGVYSLAITLPDGTVVTASTSSLTTPDVDDIANAIAAALTTLATEGALQGIVDSAVSDGVDTVTISFADAYAGVDFSISTTNQTDVTTTITDTVSPGPSDGMPIGRFVVREADALAADPLTQIWRLPASGDSGASVDGVVLRTMENTNSGSTLSSALEYVSPGKVAAAMYQGVVAMKNEGSVASAPGGLVYVQIVANGGVSPGAARANDDGSNADVVGAARAIWLDATAAGAIGRVRLHMIG